MEFDCDRAEPAALVGVNHHAVFRSDDDGLGEFVVEPIEFFLFEDERFFFRFLQCHCRIFCGIQFGQHLVLGVDHQYVQCCLGGIPFKACTRQSERIRIHLQLRCEPLPKHLPGMFQQIFRGRFVFFGDHDVGISQLFFLNERSVGVFSDGDICGNDILLGLDFGGLGFVHNAFLYITGILDCGFVQLNQFVTGFDACPFVNNPEDRTAAGNFTFDFRVVGTFQVSVLSHCDAQRFTLDRVQLSVSGRRRCTVPGQAGSQFGIQQGPGDCEDENNADQHDDCCFAVSGRVGVTGHAKVFCGRRSEPAQDRNQSREVSQAA